MGDREVRWLHDELPRLVEGGVLTREAADRVAAHYGPPPPRAPASSRVALVLFGTLGAALCGGGVILLLAHNWDQLSRPLRAAVALVPLLAAQAFTAWVIARRRDAPAWTEPAGILLGAAVFAAVALVGQTYHVPGSLDAYLLTCALLVLPAVYLLDVPRLLLAAYVAAIVAWALHQHSPAFWLLAAGAAPAYVRLVRRRAEWGLLGAGTAVALVVASIALTHEGTLWLPTAAGLLALYVGPGRTLARLRRARPAPADPGPASGAPRWAAPFALVGRVGLPVLALVLTLDVVRGLGDRGEPEEGITAALGGLAGLAALAGAVPAVRDRRWFAAVAGLAPLVAWLVWGAGGGNELLFNATLLALGIAAIAEGLAARRLAPLNFGLAIVTLHAAFRFFDEDLSFVVRGVSFILVGLAFVGLNLWLLRHRRDARPDVEGRP